MRKLLVFLKQLTAHNHSTSAVPHAYYQMQAAYQKADATVQPSLIHLLLELSERPKIRDLFVSIFLRFRGKQLFDDEVNQYTVAWN